MDDELVPKTSSRIAVITFFAVCGGAIGGALLSLVLVLSQPSALLQPNALVSWLLLTLTIAGWGAVVGCIPALVTGVAYAFLPAALQKIAVAPVIGGVISASYAVLFTEVANDNVFGLSGVGWYTVAGAGAALICAVVARQFRIDAAAERTRIG